MCIIGKEEEEEEEEGTIYRLTLPSHRVCND